jgi:aspartyl-tRNA(Asn)/glutamyl-tRNA(Gln) amidotransferase subunit A
VLGAISGHDENDRSTLRERLSLSRKQKSYKIGVLPEKFRENEASACEKAYQDALQSFRQQGHEIVEVKYPEMPYGLAVGIIVDAEGASAHEHFIRSDRLKLLADITQVGYLAASLETRATDYLWALRLRTEALKANEIWEKCDCVFTPVFYHKAPPIDQPFEKTFARMGGDDGPSNLLGWPAIAFPIGFEDNAPLGGQVIAPALREDVCLAVAKDFQQATGFHKRRPG